MTGPQNVKFHSKNRPTGRFFFLFTVVFWKKAAYNDKLVKYVFPDLYNRKGSYT